VSGSGISWDICKSAPHSKQITMPAPHHSVFYRPGALPAAQPTASEHWRNLPVSKQTSICACVCLAIYETHIQYDMNSDPRGRCLIINIRSFDKKAEVSLKPRPGADMDAGQLCTVHVLSCNFVAVFSTHRHTTVMFIFCAMLPSMLFSYYEPTSHWVKLTGCKAKPA